MAKVREITAQLMSSGISLMGMEKFLLEYSKRDDSGERIAGLLSYLCEILERKLGSDEEKSSRKLTNEEFFSNLPDRERYSYYTFGGPDVQPYFVWAESETIIRKNNVSAIYWCADYESDHNGVMGLIRFEKASPNESPIRGKVDELVLFYNNEYGKSGIRKIKNLNFYKELSGFSVDDNSSSVIVFFTADDVSPLNIMSNEHYYEVRKAYTPTTLVGYHENGGATNGEKEKEKR